MRVQSVLDAVHHLPLGPVEAENIIMLLELDGRLFHYHMTAQLIAQIAQLAPHPIRHGFKTGKDSTASVIQKQLGF